MASIFSAMGRSWPHMGAAILLMAATAANGAVPDGDEKANAGADRPSQCVELASGLDSGPRSL